MNKIQYVIAGNEAISELCIANMHPGRLLLSPHNVKVYYMDLHATSTTDLPKTAADILNFAGDNRIFLFYGDMGAGKTTLIKSLCAQLGITDAVTSPTFSIVNEYEGNTGPVYHFDFYRLKDQNEALDMGYEEYFYSGNYCFIEWPEKIAGLIPDQYTGVRIHVADDGNRQITVENI